MSKLRNRANLIITIGVAPVLALLIATILRYSDSGQYDFASAYHIPTFLFLSLIVAMFLGLTNSADDIIRDRAVLQRERNLNVRLTYYVFSKTVSLGVFALVQCILFVLIGNYILEIRGMFWPDLAIVFMTAMSGVSLGLVVSSLVGRSQNGGQHRAACPHSADHHGRRAHQIRGHESQPRAGLYFHPLVPRAPEQR